MVRVPSPPSPPPPPPPGGRSAGLPMTVLEAGADTLAECEFGDDLHVIVEKVYRAMTEALGE